MIRIRTLSVQPAGVAGDQADQRADDDRESDRHEADEERDPGAMDDPAELVADVAVGAHDVLRLARRAAEQVDARRARLLDALLDADAGPGRADTARSASAKTAHEAAGSRAAISPTTRVALAEDVPERCPARCRLPAALVDASPDRRGSPR